MDRTAPSNGGEDIARIRERGKPPLVSVRLSGQDALTEALLEVLRKGKDEWAAGDEMLLLSVHAPSNRGNMARAMIYVDALPAPFNAKLRHLIRVQLVAGLDWNTILYPWAKSSWRATFKLHRAQVSLDREIQRHIR